MIIIKRIIIIIITIITINIIIIIIIIIPLAPASMGPAPRQAREPEAGGAAPGHQGDHGWAKGCCEVPLFLDKNLTPNPRAATIQVTGASLESSRLTQAPAKPSSTLQSAK